MFPIGIEKVCTAITLLVAIMAIVTVTATPYSWGMHQSNYDASLDPIVWSRGFVKDSIRRPRLYRSNVAEEDGEDDMRLSLKKTNIAPSASVSSSIGYERRHTPKSNYADISSVRYTPERSSRKLNTMRRKFYRRLQKPDTRDRYGFV